jgi:hypothetical protein
LTPVAEHAAAAQREAGLKAASDFKFSLLVNLTSALAFEQLANEQKRNRAFLAFILQDAGLVANVFVPSGRLSHFEKYIEEYRQSKTDKNGRQLTTDGLSTRLRQSDKRRFFHSGQMSPRSCLPIHTRSFGGRLGFLFAANAN